LTTALPLALQKRLVAKRDRYEEGVRQLILGGVRSGEFLPCDAALAARAMLGAMNWSVLWFNPEGPLTAAELAEAFAGYLLRALGANSEEPHPSSSDMPKRARQRANRGRSRLAVKEVA